MSADHQHAEEQQSPGAHVVASHGKGCFLIGTSLGQAAVSGHFKALGEELARRGHKAVLLAPHQQHIIARPDSNPAILKWPSRRPTGLRDAAFLLKLHRRHRLNCLIANFPAVNWMMVVGWLARARHRIAWYHTLSEQLNADTHLAPWKVTFQRQRKRLAYFSATQVIVNSHAALDDVSSVFGVCRSKVRVETVSLRDPFLDDRIPQEPRIANRIVCAGRLHTSKGQETLIRALGLLKLAGREVSLRLLGDGPRRSELMTLAEHLKVGDLCHFAGNLSHKEIIREMALAAVVAVPSLSEAYGLVNVEALAVGTPVVASRVGGVPEIVRGGVDGILVPPGDAPALANALGRVLSDEDLRREMGVNGRRRFLEAFEQTGVIRTQANWLENLFLP